MRKVLTNDLKPGMVLAKDVYNHEDGRLLLLKGFSLQQRYIEKLKSLDIAHVYVDQEALVVEPEEFNEEQAYNEAFSTIKDVLTSVTNGENLEVAPVKETVDEIVHRIINNESVFTQLSGMRDIDNYTFHHSVDVCIYSVITGKNLGLSAEELNELGMGAILHDIGKCKVPSEILLKPGKLTEEEFNLMKLHALYGYEIIYNTEGLSKRMANIACQHHEKWDGTGYPVGLKDRQIDKLARIVTLSDVYDALTSDRCYKKKDLPYEAADYVKNNSGKLFEPDLIDVFLNNITIYPAGTMLLLSTSEIGFVIETPARMSLRPKLQIITRKEGPPILSPYTLDLTEKPQISIVEVLNNK